MRASTQVCNAILAMFFSTAVANAGAAELDWLPGCWDAEDGKSREVWVRQSDDQLIGFSVALKDSRVVFHEVLSVNIDDGVARYTAHPAGQSATIFSSTGSPGEGITFINAEHDYPQKISYTRSGDRLEATISMLDGSKPATFAKVPCG